MNESQAVTLSWTRSGDFLVHDHGTGKTTRPFAKRPCVGRRTIRGLRIPRELLG